MSRRRRLGLFLVVGAAVFAAAPAAAWAHAYLIRTVPSASATLNGPPPQLSLTYNEAVEPRFAIVSVTDAGGHQVTAGRPQRLTSDADTLVTLLERVPEGWYLVFWRAISADGHPVRGAFTFAVGPNPGPPPQFVIPSINETAATPGLVVARWIAFLALMSAIGLFVLRTLIARPLVERVPGVSLRRLSLAFWIALGVALVAVPVYVDMSTAKFALKSAFDLGGVVPLMRSSAFGRAFLDLELVLALFAVAAAIALAADRPERRQRSVAGLLSLLGALACAAAALLVPGLAGHPGQTAPRGLSLLLDWLHLTAGSLWIGGLVGLLVLWRSLDASRRVPALAICVPRFSLVAFLSVGTLVGSGIGASLLHLPTFDSLYQTSYGKSLIAKIGLLMATMPLAATNLLRTRPHLQTPELATSAVRLLRNLVSVEVVLVAGALLAASILTSLPPPPKALATIGKPSANVGPGPVVRVVTHGSYRLEFHFDPNKVAVPNSFSVKITKNGKPVRGADVTTTFAMLDMEMGQLAYTLPETQPGVFTRSAPALVMVGHWGLTFDVRPPGDAEFTVVVLDHAQG
jgi:copper transport protein